MRKILLLAMLLFPINSNAAYYWTQTISSNKYVYVEDDKVKHINKPILLSYNESAFGFKVNGITKVLLIDRFDKGISEIIPGNYMEEQFSCMDEDGDERGDYLVIVTHSNPAQIQILYTRFGGYSYSFFSNDIPVITETKNLPKKYPVIKANSKIRYPVNNDSLNPGLHNISTINNVEAICPVNIKKYIKSKLSYIDDKRFEDISLIFEILPNGKVDNLTWGFGLFVPEKLKNKFSIDMKNVIHNMPLWKVPDYINKPIEMNINIDYSATKINKYINVCKSIKKMAASWEYINKDSTGNISILVSGSITDTFINRAIKEVCEVAKSDSVFIKIWDDKKEFEDTNGDGANIAQYEPFYDKYGELKYIILYPDGHNIYKPASQLQYK